MANDPWEIGAVRYALTKKGKLRCAVCLEGIDPTGPTFHVSAHKLGTGPGDHWMVVVAFSCGHHMDDEREDAVAERLVLYADGIVSR